jgi:hypothetical protein
MTDYKNECNAADAKDKDNIGCIKSADARPAKFLENRSLVELNDCLQKRV